MARLPISAAAVRRLLAEIETSGRGEHVLAVGGPSGLAPVLQRQFHRGRAAPGAVRLGGPEGADMYVHVLEGVGTDEDTAVLRQARRTRVPAIAVVVGAGGADSEIPYVLATDVVRVGVGESPPLERIAQAIAVRLGEDGAPLAARVPLLRKAVCDQLVKSLARRNGILGAATWVPGADLPVLALNQLRLVLRLAQAHGADSIRERVPELTATLGAGFGLRAVARELLARLPVTGWLLKGAVAYGGTHLLGKLSSRMLRTRSLTG